MTVKLRFLGSLSIIAGPKVIEVNLNDGDTVLAVIERVAKSYNKVKLMKRIFYKDGGLGVNLLLNGHPCNADEKVNDKDEICIISPISGG